MREAVSQLCTVAALVGSGVVAGVMFGFGRAVVPWFATLPADRYVPELAFLDGRYDPLMPRLAKGVLAAAAVAALTAGDWTVRTLLLAGAVCTVGVAVVSESVNVALNRRIRAWNPQEPPADWEAVRTRWARGNLVRTGFGLLALVGFACAAVAAG